MPLPKGQQLKAIQHLGDFFVRCIRGGYSTLTPHAVRKELVVYILHHAEGCPLPLLASQGAAVKPDSPCLLPQQPAQTAGERGLTHAVGPSDSHYLARPDGKGQLTEHRLSFLKGAGQPLHREAFPGPGRLRRWQGTGGR